MTETASMSLSDELFRLSGWPQDEATGYTLGLLLRKLPTHFKKASIDWYGYYYLTLMQGHSSGGFICGYFNSTNKRRWAKMNWLYSGTDDTAEDATCKLCIELIKQGVLR